MYEIKINENKKSVTKMQRFNPILVARRGWIFPLYSFMKFNFP